MTFSAIAPFPGFKPYAIGAVCMGTVKLSDGSFAIPVIALLQAPGNNALHLIRVDNGEIIPENQIENYDLWPHDGCFNVPIEKLLDNKDGAVPNSTEIMAAWAYDKLDECDKLDGPD